MTARDRPALTAPCPCRSVERELLPCAAALGIAWLVVVASEMIAVNSGLGYLIIDSRNAGKRYDLVVAGMVLIGAADPSHRGPTLIDTETYCDYQTLGHMTFNVTDQGFRMYLSSYVPDVLAANIGAFVDRILERNHLRAEDGPVPELVRRTLVLGPKTPLRWHTSKVDA